MVCSFLFLGLPVILLRDDVLLNNTFLDHFVGGALLVLIEASRALEFFDVPVAIVNRLYLFLFVDFFRD